MTEDRGVHIGRGGLWIPPGLRDFDQQLVFRTPRSTIQHFGSQPLERYYGMIDESHFGDDVDDGQNPSLAPDRVSIKPQGEDAREFRVETDPDVRCDGGQSDIESERSTWLCDGCLEPKPTDQCWPCETNEGRMILCSDCRDERDVQPIVLTDGGHSNSGIDRAAAEKERGLLEQDYATPCPKCGGVVFEWWDADTCRDCEDTNDETSTEQATLMTDGGMQRFDHTMQWRVSWVDKHGSVYESMWFSDDEQAEEKYLSLCESPRIKRVVMHEKKKVRQYDRKQQPGADHDD